MMEKIEIIPKKKPYIMTKEDKGEIREMLTDIIGSHIENTNGKFEVIKVQLDRVERQTTLTNGRVSNLEKQVIILDGKEINHVNTCPQSARIKQLEDESLSHRVIKRFVWAGLGLIIMITTILSFFIETITSHILK